MLMVVMGYPKLVNVLLALHLSESTHDCHHMCKTICKAVEKKFI